MSRALLVVAATTLLPAAAQPPAPASAPRPAPAAAACSDCGVVRSINPKQKQARPATDEGKPSGLVATVPLGGGKVRVGPSQRLGKDAVVTEKSWDVIVQLDDGRFKLVTYDHTPDVQPGDRVRVQGNGLVVVAPPAAPLVPDVPAPAKK
jgi:hypothetical protein